MRRARQLGIALLLGALAGCSTFQVTSDWSPETDFSRLHTFAWLIDQQPRTGDARIDSALLDGRIRRSTDAVLAAKGYREVPRDRADFLVAYQVTLESRVDLMTVYDTYGYGWGGFGMGTAHTYTDQYEVGTLLLDVLDPKTKRLIWRGSASARVADSRTPEQRDARVREAVEAILAKFPPPSPAR